MRKSILLSWTTKDFTGRIAKIYTHKEPEDSKVLTQDNIYRTEDWVQVLCGSMHWIIQLMVINRNMMLLKKMGNVISMILLPVNAGRCKVSSLKSTVPALRQQTAQAHSFPHHTFTTEPTVFIFQEPVSTWPWTNQIGMWLLKCHFIFKIQ